MKKLQLIILIVSCNIPIFAQTLGTVSKNEIESQIYFLASDEMKGRENGSSEIDIAASYLANTLLKYNVKPKGENGSYFQYVPMQKISKASKMSVRIGDSVYNKIIPIALFENINYTDSAVFLNDGLEDDYRNIDVKDKVVILVSGFKDNSEPNLAFNSIFEKEKIAKQMGAIGIVELLPADDNFFKKHSKRANVEKFKMQSSSTDPFFHLWIQNRDSDVMERMVQNVEQKIEVKVSGIEKRKFLGRNVLGSVDGVDPILKDEFVILTAHYDHLGTLKNNDRTDSIFNGARDNAVGVAAVLNAAKDFSINPPKRSTLFIFFTGEEVGSLGSKWYTEHPIVPLERSIYCLNNDNGGYNDRSLVTVVGLERTLAKKNMIKAAEENGLQVIDTTPEDRGLFYFSDNINFAKKGIPCSTFSLGFTSFDSEIRKHYHDVSDNPETLDYDYIEKFVKSYVKSGRLISNDNSRPFWKKEDDFYGIGKKLFANKQ